MAGIVGTHLVVQVGFIVKDVEACQKEMAEFLGLEVPPRSRSARMRRPRPYTRASPRPKHTAGWPSLTSAPACSWS